MEIKCPECGKVFTPTANEYNEIIKQIRDADFNEQLIDDFRPNRITDFRQR